MNGLQHPSHPALKKENKKKQEKEKQRAGIKVRVRVCVWVGGGMFWMQSVCTWPPLARVSIAALAARQAY